MNEGRALVAVGWSAFVMEVVTVVVLGIPVHGSAVWAAVVMAAAIALSTAGLVAWAAGGASRARLAASSALAAAVLAAALLGLMNIFQNVGWFAFLALTGAWLLAAGLAAWRSRGVPAARSTLFWSGIALGAIGLVALPNAASYVASAAGGDAIAGIAVLGAPAYAAVGVAAAAVVALGARRIRSASAA